MINAASADVRIGSGFARNEEVGMRRIIRWVFGIAVVEGAILVLLSWFLPGFAIGNSWFVALAAILVTAGQVITWPLVYRLSAVLRPVLFPIASFALSGLLVIVLAIVTDVLGIGGLHVDNIWSGIAIACAMTAGITLLGVLFSLNDAAAYDWFVVRPLRGRYAVEPRSTEPGTLFLEIDGLSEPVLRRALAAGYMPTIRRWLEAGSHRLVFWEPDLSSQTSASQAGILLGDNTGIPAFRWYDKETGALMVSSRMATARDLERRLASGEGLLRTGASRWNVFSGEAPDSVCTYSTFGVAGRSGTNSYLAYFANPYTLSRAVALYIGDVFREWWQARLQAHRDERPRIHRSWRYAFIRAATTTVMQEAGLFMLLADIFRGVPAVYCTFFAYDEVAHHSGVDRPDAFQVLEKLDRVVATLERAAAGAQRPYHLVLLSDHGQSMGATFRQRTGQTLGQLVSSLVAPGARVMIDERLAEDHGHLSLAISEALRNRPDQRTTRLLQRAVRPLMAGQEAAPGLPNAGAPASAEPDPRENDVVVLASGNMGLVSFPAWSERLTYEQIIDAFPALIPGLLAEAWIGFIMVRSDAEGTLVIGRGGIHYLDLGYAGGSDPLIPYGPNAAQHLRRTDGFANAPDLLVMSAYDLETGEVAAFEELVGSHGGLGGPQTRPFLLYPAEFALGPEPIVGAAALHRVLAGWLAGVRAESPR
jgi:hypothetical protein